MEFIFKLFVSIGLSTLIAGCLTLLYFIIKATVEYTQRTITAENLREQRLTALAAKQAQEARRKFGRGKC